MAPRTFLRRVSSVLLAAVAGASIGLFLGSLGDREPVADVVAREARCLNAYTRDAAFGLARDRCRADVPGFAGQR